MVGTVIGRLAGCRAARVTVAARLSADALRAGGTLQAFGTGHSEAVATDFAGRAGGLLPTNRILLRDLVMFGGEAREILRNYLSANTCPRTSPAGTSTTPPSSPRYAGRVRRTA